MMRPVLPFDIEFELPILEQADVVVAQVEARSCAAALGFSKKEQWEIAIALTEAATNILKYANKGTIHVRRLSDDPPSLEFEALDRGPGIPHIGDALLDGYSEGSFRGQCLHVSEAKGIGSGLPAIQRLMDSLVVTRRAGGGTSLIAQKTGKS